MTFPAYDDRLVNDMGLTRQTDDAHDDAVLDRMTSAEIAARGERRNRPRNAGTVADDFARLRSAQVALIEQREEARNERDAARRTVQRLTDELRGERALLAAYREVRRSA